MIIALLNGLPVLYAYARKLYSLQQKSCMSPMMQARAPNGTAALRAPYNAIGGGGSPCLAKPAGGGGW